jgi:hypothetical protein
VGSIRGRIRQNLRDNFPDRYNDLALLQDDLLHSSRLHASIILPGSHGAYALRGVAGIIPVNTPVLLRSPGRGTEKVRKMTRFYIKWHVNTRYIPVNPEERIKNSLKLLEMVRADLQSGILKEWGMFNDNSGGYAIAETDEKTLHTAILKWIPYTTFDIKTVLTVDQAIADYKQAGVAAKK